MNELEQQLRDLNKEIKTNKKLAKRARKSQLTHKINKIYLLSLLTNFPLILILHAIIPSTVFVQITSSIISLAIGVISTYKTEKEFKGLKQKEILQIELESNIKLKQAENKCQIINSLIIQNANIPISNEDWSELDTLTTNHFLATEAHTYIVLNENKTIRAANSCAFSMLTATIYNLPLIILHSLPQLSIPFTILLGLLGHRIYKNNQDKNYQAAIKEITGRTYDKIIEIDNNSDQISLLAQNIKAKSKAPLSKNQSAPTEFSKIPSANLTPPSKSNPFTRTRK